MSVLFLVHCMWAFAEHVIAIMQHHPLSFCEGMFCVTLSLAFFPPLCKFNVIFCQRAIVPNFCDDDSVPVPVIWVEAREDREELDVYATSASFIDFCECVQLDFSHLVRT